jgi:hypothetical protein
MIAEYGMINSKLVTRNSELPTRIIIATALLMLVAASGGCARKKPGKAVSAGQAAIRDFPSQESWNSSLIMTRAGKQQAVIKYGHMTQFDSRKMAYFDGGVQVDFYNSEGAHTSRLNSSRGEYNQLTEEVRGWNVTVVSDTGITCARRSRRWDLRCKKIVSDSSVIVTTRKLDTFMEWANAYPICLSSSGIRQESRTLAWISIKWNRVPETRRIRDSIPHPAPDSSSRSMNP